MAEEYPKTAFILTLIGAILGLVVGIPLAMMGGFLAMIFPALGLLCIVIVLIGGVLGLVAAILMRDPEKVKLAGVLAIIAAFLAPAGIISFILLLIGGILALTWKRPQNVPQTR